MVTNVGVKKYSAANDLKRDIESITSRLNNIAETAMKFKEGLKGINDTTMIDIRDGYFVSNGISSMSDEFSHLFENLNRDLISAERNLTILHIIRETENIEEYT